MRLLVAKMEASRLHNSDMKLLVAIFRGEPLPVSQGREKAHHIQTKNNIHNLPRRLRSSHFSVSLTNLCSTHKGLDAHLVTDICAWVQHEIDSAIGRFLYPLIMSNALTKNEEMKVRQLEPVSQMWQSDFEIEASTPPGHEPVQGGEKWAFQTDKCPACILARLGSDCDILFALFAGMVGRMKDKATGTNNGHGVVSFEKIRSKRLRFVRYWIKASPSGNQLLFDAGRLGLKMKQMRREWKMEQRRLRHEKHSYPIRHGSEAIMAQGPQSRGEFCANHEGGCARSSGTSVCRHRMSHHDAILESGANTDTTEPYQPTDFASSIKHDDKLGPMPRPSNLHCLTPMGPLGFDVSRFCESISKTTHTPSRRPPSSVSNLTVRPEDSISSVGEARLPAPLRPHRPEAPKLESQTEPRTHDRHDSVIGDLDTLPQRWPSLRQPGQPSLCSIALSQTIASYDGGSDSARKAFPHHTRQDPLDNPFYNTLQMKDQLVEKYRIMLASPADALLDQDVASTLPPPRPQSIYSAFGSNEFEESKFEAADVEEEGEWDNEEMDANAGEVTPPLTPRGRRPSDTGTSGDDLY